ncbi:MAG: transposase [Terracidiphilus sp.]
MKGERIRYRQTGEFHFLTFSCYRRRLTPSTVAAMELFEDALERARQRYLFIVAGYVVMPGHVHLLLNEPQRGLLSRAVQALKLSVSMRARETPSGRRTITISTSRPTRSSWRSCGTSIGTRSVGSGRETGGVEVVERSPLSNGHARNRRDRIRVDSPRERLATARVDALPSVRLFLPGPQVRGTGATRQSA